MLGKEAELKAIVVCGQRSQVCATQPRRPPLLDETTDTKKFPYMTTKRETGYISYFMMVRYRHLLE